jgi:hypothetical protein
MKAEAIRQAKEALTRLQEQENRLQRATSFREVEDAWLLMLNFHDQIWQKLNHAPETGPEKGWLDREYGAKRKDPLLIYAQEARGANHHGIERVVDRGPGLIRIVGPGAHERLMPGEVLRLVPVKNRGREFPVPDWHGEIPMGERSINRVAQMLEMASRALVQMAEHIAQHGFERRRKEK